MPEPYRSLRLESAREPADHIDIRERFVIRNLRPPPGPVGRPKTEVEILREKHGQVPEAIVFFCMEAIGHINPILHLVRELRLQGYRALILTTKPLSIAEKLKWQGFEVHDCQEPVRDDEWDVDVYEFTYGRQPNPDELEELEQLWQEKVDAEDRLKMETSTTLKQGDSEKHMADLMHSVLERFRQGPVNAFEATYTLGGALDKHFDFVAENHDKIEAKLASFRPKCVIVDHVIPIPCATKICRKWFRVYSGFPSIIFSSVNTNYVSGVGLSPTECTKKHKEFEASSKATLREKIRRYWVGEHKLPDWPSQIDMVPSSPYLNICFGPDELSFDRDRSLKKLPKSWTRFEHLFDSYWCRIKPSPLVDQVRHLRGKLIYFSMGTLASNDIRPIERLLNFLSKVPHKVIVSMGPRHKEIKLYPNMWGAKFIDQRALLASQEVDLFITHSGHNSIIEAFYYGVRSLICMPVFADQFDLAQRVQDCGLGVRLDPFKVSEEKFLSTIEQLLDSEDPREERRRRHMDYVGENLRAKNLLDQAVSVIEKAMNESP